MRFTTTLGVSLLGWGMVLASLAATSAEHDSAWVARRVEQWQPTAKERRWESIGWATDIRSALRLAKGHQRPVFLFTLDGRMNVGRC